MTGPTTSHDEMWDELTAGYALDAIEPEDEARLLEHLAGCAHCRATLDDFTLVASQLGSLANGEEEPPPWQQIAPRITRVTPITSIRRRRQPRILAAAAAVVLLAAGGVLAWHYTHGTTSPPAQAAIAACSQRPGCSVVRLHGSSGVVAAVIVQDGRASLVPLHLASPSAARAYALWQLPRDGSPIFLDTFRDTGRATPPSPLAVPVADTTAFAVSVEPAGTRPERPSTVIAVGPAPA